MGRLARIVNEELIKPQEQYPSLIHFIGTRAKDAAMREIFPGSRKRNITGAINLRLEASSINANRPILFSDSKPCGDDSVVSGPTHCHEETSYATLWPHSAFDILHARLIFLFSDVICLFADDFSGLQAVAEQIKAWVAIGSASTLPPEVRPSLTIVTSGSGPLQSLLAEEFRAEIYRVVGENITDSFRSVKLFRLADDYLSPPARFLRLKDEIIGNAREMHAVRVRSQCLFSALHLSDLFRQAAKHVTSTFNEKFDFFTAARRGNPLNDRFTDHLQVFLRLIEPFKPAYDVISSLIASSILVDAYPPLSHRKRIHPETTLYFERTESKLITGFQPRDIFRSLYYDSCLGAFQAISYSEDFAKSLCDNIGIHLENMVRWTERNNIPSIRYHEERLQSQSQLWQFIKSNQICLYCLTRLPERVFRCGHSICDTCRGGALVVNLKPKTAGVRVLTIDGGGAKAAIPAEYLCRLEQLLHKCPLYEAFELVSGSSSGGLVVICIFWRRQKASYCGSILEAIVKACFDSSNPKLGRLGTLYRYISTNAMYNEDGLEECLKNEFTKDSRLFGYINISGVKIALSAVSNMGSKSIITNYNGTVPLEQSCGYNLIRPVDVSQEPMVWEAGRATSAAPLYFKPMTMAAGRFIDGGLGFPNPIDITSWERRRIWPEVKEADVCLSLGTGVTTPTNTDCERQLHPIKALWNSFMSFLDGESSWVRFKNELKDDLKDDYLRFNPTIPSSFKLDTTNGIPLIRQNIHKQIDHEDLLVTAYRLLVSNFYFVLDDLWRYSNGNYQCTGKIRCRADIYNTVEALSRLGASNLEFVTDTIVLGGYQPNYDICQCCQRYAKGIQFSVRHPSDRIELSLRSQRGTRKLSGFPQTISWFADIQGLSSPFGTPDHDDLVRHRCASCEIYPYSLKRGRPLTLSRSVKRRRG
ncbi:calcium-independent phospholipase [Trichophyton mentagrophytes]|nr:calcium-independent phospholipase [Trichophyton mentagrophytes]